MKKLLAGVASLAVSGALLFGAYSFEDVSTQQVSIDAIEKMTVSSTDITLNGESVTLSSKSAKKLWWFKDTNIDYFEVKISENKFGFKKYDVVKTGSSKVDNVKDMFEQLAQVAKQESAQN